MNKMLRKYYLTVTGMLPVSTQFSDAND